jgi:transcriptional regulator with XRE-family HTH domain
MYSKETTMKMCNLIGPQVRKLREEKGWTQRTLSEKLQVAGLDISRSSLAKVESRLIKVSDNELFYFARVFNVSLCQLFPLIHPNDPDLHEKMMRYLDGRE